MGQWMFSVYCSDCTVIVYSFLVPRFDVIDYLDYIMSKCTYGNVTLYLKEHKTKEQLEVPLLKIHFFSLSDIFNPSPN